MEKRRKHGPGFYLFLGALRSREMYVEHRFANLVWGIDALLSAHLLGPY